MKKLKISVGKDTTNDSLVASHKLKVSKKLFSKLFNNKATITIIASGNSVKTIEISDEKNGGVMDGKM